MLFYENPHKNKFCEIKLNLNSVKVRNQLREEFTCKEIKEALKCMNMNSLEEKLGYNTELHYNRPHLLSS